ncbi:hypothetical protein [Sorangium sp. So ce131]|uniref:hypothetical protein n=1 Tax=Sorangium sp. So ce131 TaxID=3133282 RepID=UPI003F5FC8FD
MSTSSFLRGASVLAITALGLAAWFEPAAPESTEADDKQVGTAEQTLDGPASRCTA